MARVIDVLVVDGEVYARALDKLPELPASIDETFEQQKNIRVVAVFNDDAAAAPFEDIVRMALENPLQNIEVYPCHQLVLPLRFELGQVEIRKGEAPFLRMKEQNLKYLERIAQGRLTE